MTRHPTTVEENLRCWDLVYQWPEEGEEWSASWGNARFQWLVSILPRIHRFLPVDTILEIAPGRGRWTQFLQSQCNRLILVDLSPSCIEFCAKRFSSCSHMEFHVNDGVSLSMIEDESLDFVFSFDSLVHAEAQVVLGYMKQLGRKLRVGGTGFLHHSNAGTYRNILFLASGLKRLPLASRIARYFDKQWRSPDMTAELMHTFYRESGLTCLSQELIAWERTVLPIDCLTTFLRPANGPGVEARVVRNRLLMREAQVARLLSELYGDEG